MEEKLTTDEDAGQRLFEVESDDGKCETSHLDKGETNETINVNDSNDSEREVSNKISEAKEGSKR